jgi:hypothetical protein
MMRPRLAAAAAGAVAIAAAIIGSSLHSGPVTAATNTVEPLEPSVFLEGAPQCQRISRVPGGADRMKLLVTYVTGGARHLHVELTGPRGRVSTGDVKPVSEGETLVKLRPRTQATHPATLCLSNPGKGRIVIGGGPKRVPKSAPGASVDRRRIASVIFVRPGSASWVSQTGTIADRYDNAQTGPLGSWSLWFAGLLAIIAAALGLWSLLVVPERAP